MAAALSWEAARGLPREIATLLGADAHLLLAIPEHKVALPGGRRDSQCDVFALVRIGDETCAVAIEAKVNEPFGPTIGEWLVNASPGKIERLRFLCALLGITDPPPNLRYQLFHRAAAAVIEADRFNTDRAAMIIQSFAQDRRWFADFADFAKAWGHEVEPGVPITFSLRSGLLMTIGWATGSPEFV